MARKKMSRNDVFFVKEVSGKWHGWCTTAEQVVSDKDNKRILHLSKSIKADGVDSLYNKLVDEFGFSEYGMNAAPFLPKDGTPIEVA